MTQKAEVLAGLRAEDYQIIVVPDLTAEIKRQKRDGFVGHARKDRSPTRITLPFDWHGTDSSDRNWMFQLHAWRMLDPHLCLMLQDGGKRASFEHSIAIVTDWIRDNCFGKAGTYTWYDMSTGIRASKLAFLVRAAPAFDCNLSTVPGFDNMVTRHFIHLMNPKELSKGNHGLFQMQGLKSLASAFPDHSESRKAEKYAVQNIIKLIESQMGEHGVHTENSPDYHFFACRRIGVLLDSSDWRIPGMDFVRQLMTKAENVKPWLVDATSHIVPIGDSAQGVVKPARLPSLKEWPHQADTDHLGAILDGYGVVRSHPDLPVEKSSYLFLTASYQSNTHKHDDCLSFVWQEGGAEILIDPGKYGYQKDTARAYFQGRNAHNSVEFNQLSLPRDRRPPYGSGMKEVTPLADGAWSIRAEAPCSAEGDMHQRRLIFHPNRSLIVFDRIVPVGKDRNSYTLWWHFPPQAQLILNDAACTITGLADKRTLRIRYASHAGPFKVRIHEGVEKPRLQGWISPSYLKREPAPVLGLSTSVKGVFGAVTIFDWNSNTSPALYSNISNDLSSDERTLLNDAC